MTVYLQLIGFSDASASLVNSCFLAGAALGGVLGGFVGDWAASMNSDHGRILACQFSVSMGIPFTIVLLKCLPFNGEPLTVAIYGVLMFFFGLLHVWAAPACNNPVFAEIVPPHLRNLVYAFDRYVHRKYLCHCCTQVVSSPLSYAWSWFVCDSAAWFVCNSAGHRFVC